MPSRKKPSQEDARGKRKTQPPVSQIAKTRDKKCVSALSENLAGLRASRKKTKEQKIKDLEKEKKRILKLLRENEVQLKEVRERTDADEEGKSSCKKASKSRSQHDALPEHQMNLGLFDALADLWNFVFESLPSRSLIILSMVSSQGKAAVDAAHMNLWTAGRSASWFPMIKAVVVGNEHDMRYRFYHWCKTPLDGMNYTLPSSYDENAGRMVRKYELRNTASLRVWSNQVLPLLPVGCGFSLWSQDYVFSKCDLKVKGTVICAKNEGQQGSVLLDARDKGLVLLHTPRLTNFLPRVSAALLLTPTKCLMCKKPSFSQLSGMVISPSFPPHRRILCKHCYQECTVNVNRTKHYNVYGEKQTLMMRLPTNRNYCDVGVFPESRVLKEQIAALFDTSWDIFVCGSNARWTQWKEQQRIKYQQEKDKEKQKNEMRLKAEYRVVQRLAKFVGPSADSPSNYRITAAGKPMGLLVGTETFLKARTLDLSTAKESGDTRKLLYALEGGSSIAIKTFQQTVAKELLDLEIGRRVDILSEEIFKEADLVLPFSCKSPALQNCSPGNTVVVHNLVNKSSFNGRVGVVQPESVALLASHERVAIKFNDGTLLRLKDKNIRSQYNRPSLEPKYVRVPSYPQVGVFRQQGVIFKDVKNFFFHMDDMKAVLKEHYAKDHTIMQTKFGIKINIRGAGWRDHTLSWDSKDEEEEARGDGGEEEKGFASIASLLPKTPSWQKSVSSFFQQ